MIDLLGEMQHYVKLSIFECALVRWGLDENNFLRNIQIQDSSDIPLKVIARFHHDALFQNMVGCDSLPFTPKT